MGAVLGVSDTTNSGATGAFTGKVDGAKVILMRMT
jgi:hypothetical protein